MCEQWLVDNRDVHFLNNVKLIYFNIVNFIYEHVTYGCLKVYT